MCSRIVLSLSLVLTILSSGFCDFPGNVRRCKPGDSECIKDTINSIFSTMAEGDPDLNLVKLNPLHVTAINIKQGNESPVNVELKFRDSDLYGVDNIRVQRVKGFGDDMTKKHFLNMKGGYVSLIGKYEVKGKVLLLPLYGSGDSNITLVNPDIKLVFNGKPVEKNGKKHMQIENFKVDCQISRLYIRLDDLFNGDKTLSDNTNLFLNENWEEIYNELKDGIFNAFGQIFKEVIQNVFEKFPYDEVFTA